MDLVVGAWSWRWRSVVRAAWSSMLVSGASRGFQGASGPLQAERRLPTGGLDALRGLEKPRSGPLGGLLGWTRPHVASPHPLKLAARLSLFGTFRQTSASHRLNAQNTTPASHGAARWTDTPTMCFVPSAIALADLQRRTSMDATRCPNDAHNSPNRPQAGRAWSDEQVRAVSPAASLKLHAS